MGQPNADPRLPSASAKADLVERARAGDHSAFAILARSGFGRMYGTAKLILRDQYAAEDAGQEALLLAWRHVATIRDPDAWDVWMYRLTVRACYRLARARGAREVRELHVPLDRPAPALTDLPLEQRAVIVLHFYVDLSMVQAAAVLDVPVGTAKSRLHRGLEALRASLGHEPERVGIAIRERPT